MRDDGWVADTDPSPQRPPRRSRRDLDDIFGDVLPSTTSDERDPEPAPDESWYERNRPPHHEDRD
jgi:hypothetical protein